MGNSKQGKEEEEEGKQGDRRGRME